MADKAVTTVQLLAAFAQYMQIHALEATGGFVYAQMGQYLAKPGTPKSQLTPDGAISNTQYVQLDPKRQSNR